jgi:hypothetical protein
VPISLSPSLSCLGRHFEPLQIWSLLLQICSSLSSNSHLDGSTILLEASALFRLTASHNTREAAFASWKARVLLAGLHLAVCVVCVSVCASVHRRLPARRLHSWSSNISSCLPFVLCCEFSVLLLRLFGYSSVQVPSGPALFYTRARSYAKTDVLTTRCT